TARIQQTTMATVWRDQRPRHTLTGAQVSNGGQMTSTNPKATTSSPDKPFRILSCDGGGLHGVLSLCALVKFEEETGKSCHDLFDLFAGTSTGSIIAGAIAAGMSATQVLEIYEKQGAEIFSRSEQCILLPWTFITKPKYS